MLRNYLFDYIFIEGEEGKTKSGIYVAEQKYKKIPNKGKVFAVASNIKGIEKGAVVFFDDASPYGLRFEGKRLLPVNIKKIIGIYNV